MKKNVAFVWIILLSLVSDATNVTDFTELGKFGIHTLDECVGDYDLNFKTSADFDVRTVEYQQATSDVAHAAKQTIYDEDGLCFFQPLQTDLVNKVEALLVDKTKSIELSLSIPLYLLHCQLLI